MLSSPLDSPAAVQPNPLGIAGLEFVEFAAPDPDTLARMFRRLGFTAVGRHRHKAVTLFRHGELNFVINAERDSFAQKYASDRGLSVCALALRVEDAALAHARAIEAGAWDAQRDKLGAMELNIPAIQGIGDGLIYFVDRWRGKGGARGGIGDISVFDIDFKPYDEGVVPGASDAVHAPAGTDASSASDASAQAAPTHLACKAAGHAESLAGIDLLRIDHLAQTFAPGELTDWLDFYRDVLGFVDAVPSGGAPDSRETPHVMVSPCGTLKIPLYEEGSLRAQRMHAFLGDHQSDTVVQHIALETSDIFSTVAALRRNGLELVCPPQRYYADLAAHGNPGGMDLARLEAGCVLIEGGTAEGGAPGMLLQVFLRPQTGGVAFEIVQRLGAAGFGEGNLQALAGEAGEGFPG